MEEQKLSWWKRALRATIGTLRSGFGLFGKPQKEITPNTTAESHETLQTHTEEAVLSVSPRAPEPESAPETNAAVIPALKKEVNEAELPEEPVDEVTEPESIETSEPGVVVTAPEAKTEEVAEPEPEPEPEPKPKLEELIIEVPANEIAEEREPEEEAAAVEGVLDEPAETDAEPEPEIEAAVIADAEHVTEAAEAESEAVVEMVEVQKVEDARESEINPVEEAVQADVNLDADELVVCKTEFVAEEVEPVIVETEAPFEQESAHKVTMESVPEPVEEVEQHEELSDGEQVEVMAESIPEITSEVDEMKPLSEEPGTKSEATPEHVAVPVEVQATAEPEAVPEIAPAPEAPAEQHPIKHAIKEDDDKSTPFSIIVSQVYEGPMDLLLDLIRKQDIDIYDIPIAKITQQFLAYVEQLRASDMDMAGEFIYTASLLIHIKSKTLLPREPSGQDDQYDDPRRELVERLLEHERFKNAAQMLQQKQMIEDATWTNPGLREFKGDAGTEPELAADTVDLVRVFQEILDRARNRPVINVEEDSVTVGQMIQFLGRRLNMEDKPIALRKLLAHTHSQRALVAMFLALLELVRLQAVLLRQDRLFSEIFIKKHEGFDSVMTEGFLAARDDWQ